MLSIEELVQKHFDQFCARLGTSLKDTLRNALTEQAETHARELREYEATVANLKEHIRQLEAERVPLADVAKATQLLKNERDDEAYELLVKVLAAAPAQENSNG